MKNFLRPQPISMSINVNIQAFMNLGWSIYHGPCSSRYGDLNHAMVIMGYVTENGIDY